MTALDRQQGVVAAMIAALSGDLQLAALIGRRIYDAPPPRVVLPSIGVRAVSGLDASSSDTEAQLLAVDLDVWDRYVPGANLGGPRLVMAHIRRILHMRPLTSPGVSILAVRCIASHGPCPRPRRHRSARHRVGRGPLWSRDIAVLTDPFLP